MIDIAGATVGHWLPPSEILGPLVDSTSVSMIVKTPVMVEIIDVETNQTAEPAIPVSAPRAIAFTPDGARAYVLNYTGSVSVIDVRANVVLGTPIKVGAQPSGVAVTPDGGRVYVVNYGHGTVSVINTATNAVEGDPIAVGFGPSGIAITPDGGTAYVANTRSNNISVIDTATNVVRTTVAAKGQSPVYIAIAGPPTPIVCSGDCNGDHTVTIDELLTLVNIALGTAHAQPPAHHVVQRRRPDRRCDNPGRPAGLRLELRRERGVRYV